MNYSKEAFALSNGPYRSHSAILADDSECVSLDSPRGWYNVANLPVSGLGSSRGSQLLGGSYNAHDENSTNTLQNIAGIQTGPAWLENDLAGSVLKLQYDLLWTIRTCMWHAPYGLNLFVMTASAYLESKDEGLDFSSPQRAFLEQVDMPLWDAKQSKLLEKSSKS
jgi:hypothetical protein